jgi:hypothetical protein
VVKTLRLGVAATREAAMAACGEHDWELHRCQYDSAILCFARLS